MASTVQYLASFRSQRADSMARMRKVCRGGLIVCLRASMCRTVCSGRARCCRAMYYPPMCGPL